MSVISMTRGDTASFALAFTDAAGAPIDLTGLTLTFTAKERLLDLDADAIITKVDGDGLEVDVDPTTGLATLTVVPADTEGLVDATRLYWDIQLDDGAGTIRTPLSGRLVIGADVTLGSLAS